ncbi:hypothetical protein VaNZ11_016238 [Volvox africanus]|uniref:Membrane-associated protein n=1 Tax=Volvox africanus TaxID=51714 RepID=A0ABQ5SN94_9CHLO|nr:hypothetical protein VaNZ11_016238 [Volvox africanus]
MWGPGTTTARASSRAPRRRGGAAAVTATLATAVVAAVLVLTAAPTMTRGAELLLYNSTLIVSNATCSYGPLESAVQTMVLAAAARNAVGLRRRADHAQGYLCANGMSLCRPQPVLESHVEIDANNSHIVVQPPNTTFNSLLLAMVQNNTLSLSSGDIVTFSKSTLALGPPAGPTGRDNWFYILNGTTVQMYSTRLNFTDGQAWVLENGTFVTSNSLLEFTNTVMYGNGSEIIILNSTWYVHTDPLLASPPVVNLSHVVQQPYIWIDNSDISVQGSLVVFSNVTALVTFSTFLLTDSTLQLYNTTLELWGSPIGLNNSRIELYNGSNIQFNCGSLAVFESVVTVANLTRPPLRGTANDLIGTPLGGVDTIVYEEPYGAFVLL